MTNENANAQSEGMTEVDVNSVNFFQSYGKEERDRVISAISTAYGIIGKILPPDPLEREAEFNKIIADFVKAGEPTGEADELGRVPIKRVNIYTDLKGTNLITVDIHEGTTPFVLPHPDNGRQMKSLCYLVPQDITPEGEWYMPTPDVIATMPKALQRHCFDGGLILCRYGTQDKKPMKQRVKSLTNKREAAKTLKVQIIQYLRTQGASFDETDLDTMYQDYDKDRFLCWGFAHDSKKGLLVRLEFCDATVDDDCELQKPVAVANLQEFLQIYAKKAEVDELYVSGKIHDLYRGN